MSRIATFILARGGSKRVPKKNILEFQGKPLVMWTVETAIAMGFPVFLFTDMTEIRDMVSGYDLDVMDKLFENPDGIHHTGLELAAYNENPKIRADHIILLQPTSPYRDVLKILHWVDTYLTGGYDAGVAAKKLPEKFYYMQGIQCYPIGERNYNSNVKFPIYAETGSFYIFKKEQIVKNHILNTEKLIVFDDPYNIDIDEMEDCR